MNNLSEMPWQELMKRTQYTGCLDYLNYCRELERRLALVDQLKAELVKVKEALKSLKHADGCYCEASFSGPGCHPRHSPECEMACKALTDAPSTTK